MYNFRAHAVSSGTQYNSCCSVRINTGNITLYNINCTGQSGNFIQDCSYSIISGYSVGRCSLQTEIIAECYEPSNCSIGDLRLVDGNSTFEGRVELCTQGFWGAIAYPGWSSIDAKVVCRQLGLLWECEFDIATITLSYYYVDAHITNSYVLPL